MSSRGMYGLLIGSFAPRPPPEADIATRCKALPVDVSGAHLDELMQELKENVIARIIAVPVARPEGLSLTAETCFALLEKRKLHPLDRAQVHLYLAGMWLDEDLAVQEDHLLEADDLLSWFEHEAAVGGCGETVGKYCRSLRRRHTKLSRDIEADLLWMDECDRAFAQDDESLAKWLDQYGSDEVDDSDEDDESDEVTESDEGDDSNEEETAEEETAVVKEAATSVKEAATLVENAATSVEEAATVVEEAATVVEKETAAVEKDTPAVEKDTAAVDPGKQGLAVAGIEQSKRDVSDSIMGAGDSGDGILAAISDTVATQQQNATGTTLVVQETAADGETAAGQQHAASDSHSDHASGSLKLPARSIRKYGSKSMILRGANNSFAERNRSRQLKEKAPERDIRTMWQDKKDD
ncbi:hypothetical protein B0A48_08489 [Cryoendolithus antarcticus]|uniref:Uncharacterized protein n=1 Tax=Cryoendolithus antarcticus TaxID=1507870 RepID=A0A1V8T6A1_9PEZI|nr:hypothetical protein B0A48_08489 [Cryoendolithus antarcticus]